MKPLNQRPTLYRHRPRTLDYRLIAELYRGGASSTEIACRLGTGSGNVLYAVRKMGLRVRSIAEGHALQRARNARRKLIAAAAQRVFGHLYAPPVERPLAMPPVNDMFAHHSWDEWEDAW